MHKPKISGACLPICITVYLSHLFLKCRLSTLIIIALLFNCCFEFRYKLYYFLQQLGQILKFFGKLEFQTAKKNQFIRLYELWKHGPKICYRCHCWIKVLDLIPQKSDNSCVPSLSKENMKYEINVFHFCVFIIIDFLFRFNSSSQCIDFCQASADGISIKSKHERFLDWFSVRIDRQTEANMPINTKTIKYNKQEKYVTIYRKSHVFCIANQHLVIIIRSCLCIPLLIHKNVYFCRQFAFFSFSLSLFVRFCCSCCALRSMNG